MAEFVNINSDDEHLNIAPIVLSSIPVVNLDTQIVSTPKLKIPYVELAEEENSYEIIKFEEVKEEPNFIGVCAALTGDNKQDEHFKIENYFSELTSEYQRALARYNLGISDLYSLV